MAGPPADIDASKSKPPMRTRWKARLRMAKPEGLNHLTARPGAFNAEKGIGRPARTAAVEAKREGFGDKKGRAAPA
jgi:hypothetical protein